MAFRKISNYRTPVFLAAQEIEERFPGSGVKISLQQKNILIKRKKVLDYYSSKEIEFIVKKHFPKHQLVVR
ncbi:MAG: hypothetical protein UU76_C0003G0026 [Parcubacteria group bacterium GW2011_GWC1_41_7]|nr:MAG: hypothetical protein UU76_C0003G0026 [Parcubacteria group bacterium GW2011_GWC1_41_7]